MATIEESKKTLAADTLDALKNYNSTYNKSWTLGDNYTNQGTEFETFINKFLFPKLTETALLNVSLGNRFNWLAKEVTYIGQISEEYALLDTIPVSMDLSKSEELMLKRNYPKMVTKLYGPGDLKKLKFTLNNNDVRQNWATLQDATNWAVAVYRKQLSNINVQEEREIKSMLIDYAINQAEVTRHCTSQDDFFNELTTAIFNLQNNSEKYNEANKASGGTIGRYTTVSQLDNLLILTTDELKSFLLNTKLANTFQVAGIDLSKKIISFDDLGGTYRTTADIQITDPQTLNVLKYYGDYVSEMGNIIPKGSVFTYSDVTKLNDFKNKIQEVAPKSNLFGYVFDVNKLRYKRSTQNMFQPPFYNSEFGEFNYWLHYYSFHAMSPFFNSIVISGD